MKQYPEKLADGRVLVVETLDVGALGDEYTNEGVLRRSLHLFEGEAPKGTIGVVEGVAAKADIINKNRRFYSLEVYQAAVGRAQPLIKEGNFLGEVDHPFYGSLQGGAFRFTKLHIEGKLVRFEGVILNTDGGKHLKALIEGGVGVQVSTRGYASATIEKRKIGGVEIPISIIGKDLTFEGIDFVLFASNPAGRVTSAKTESAPAEAADTTTEEVAMTLADIREKHAGLVAEIEAAAREGFVPEADVEAKVAEAKEAGKKEALESAEHASRVTALAAILEAVKPFVPEAAKAAEAKTESEAEKKVATLEQVVKDLTESVKALTDEKAAAEKAAKEAEAKAEAEKAEAERVKAVEEKVSELLKDYTHGDLIREKLLAAESAEAAEKLFAEQKDFIESIAARSKVKGSKKDEGAGTTDIQETETTEKEVVAEVKRQRSIAYDA